MPGPLRHMLRDGTDVDVTFHVVGWEFPVHMVVLAVCRCRGP
jgi:hypothetical protein